MQEVLLKEKKKSLAVKKARNFSKECKLARHIITKIRVKDMLKIMAVKEWRILRGYTAKKWPFRRGDHP